MDIYFPADSITNILFIETIFSAILAWNGISTRIRGKSIPLWVITFIVTLLTAWWANAITPVAFIWFGILGLAGYLLKMGLYPAVGRTILIIMGFALAVGALPGFNNTMLINGALISPNAVPYYLSLSLNKIGAGLIIFYSAFGTTERKILSPDIYNKAALPAVLTILLVLGLSNITLINIDFKLSRYFIVFAISNILFTALTEEAFFRGLFQKPLQRVIGVYPAIFISAILFGLAHYGMGRIDYVMVAVLAGVGYAYVYTRTGTITASIFTHWGLNLLHFVLFTYPFLLTN